MGEDEGVGRERERQGLKELELLTSVTFRTDETKRIDHSSPAIKTTSTSAGQREGTREGAMEGAKKGMREGARERRKSGTFSISCLDRISLGWGRKKKQRRMRVEMGNPRINPKGHSRFTS